MFFRSCFRYFFTIYSKRYSYNIRDRSKKSRSREYKNYFIISVIRNVERASMARARARVPRFHVRGTESGPNDVCLTLPADCVQDGVVEVSYCMFNGETSI